MNEFERVLVEKSKIYKSIVNTLLLDLAKAHNADMESIGLSAFIKLKKRIVELEAENAELEAQVPRVVEVKDTPFRYACVCGSTAYEVDIFCHVCGAKLDWSEVEK